MSTCNGRYLRTRLSLALCAFALFSAALRARTGDPAASQLVIERTHPKHLLCLMVKRDGELRRSLRRHAPLVERAVCAAEG